MYSRVFVLSQYNDCEFVFQAQPREPSADPYSEVYEARSFRNDIFLVRVTLNEALDDLKEKAMDGQVMRFVKTSSVTVGSKHTPSLTAGCAARFWLDTSATDGDTNHFTKEQMESKGCIVSELYQGPFSLNHCHLIITKLQYIIPHLGVIKLGCNISYTTQQNSQCRFQCA